MRVTVQLFARLKDVAGRDEMACEVRDGASVRDVWQVVTAAHADLEPFGGSISCAVNDDFAGMRTTVRDGDRIAFLPPVSGGDEPCR